MLSAFRPAWWCRGPHAQTLVASLLARKPRVSWRRERWETPDGDFLDLDFVGKGELVLLLHGLQGSSSSSYILRLARLLVQKGRQVAVLNFRGCSGEPNRQPRSYHSGETGDLDWVSSCLREQGRPIRKVVGFSLGANVLLKWLGERGGDSEIEEAVAVSVPFQLAAAADHLASGFGRVYQDHLVVSLKKAVLARGWPASHDWVPRAAQDPAMRTFRQFDDAITAPLHGFDGADDYYARSSSAAWLGAIRVRTSIRHSWDDPFLPSAAVPNPQQVENPHLLWEISPRGGHVGFVRGWIPGWAQDGLSPWIVGRLGRST